MTNIIFNQQDYNDLSKKDKLLYEQIGSYVYALKPKYMQINFIKLPKWLSIKQYNFFKNKIYNYYKVTTRGFHKEAVVLMKLDEKLAHGFKYKYSTSNIPKDSRITKLEYLKLKAEDKNKYFEITVGNTIMYAKKVTLIKKPILSNLKIHKPITGIKKIPIGRYIEVK